LGSPVPTAQLYVDLIGTETIREEGRHAFDAGDYRWAAQILHRLVFAQPDNQAAQDLQADAYEQMGYQIEGPQWRGIFLTAARELSEGVQPARRGASSDMQLTVSGPKTALVGMLLQPASAGQLAQAASVLPWRGVPC